MVTVVNVTAACLRNRDFGGNLLFNFGVAAVGHHVGVDIAEEDNVVAIDSLQVAHIVSTPRLQRLDGIEADFNQQRDELSDVAIAVEHQWDSLRLAPLLDASMARPQKLTIDLRREEHPILVAEVGEEP